MIICREIRQNNLLIDQEYLIVENTTTDTKNIIEINIKLKIDM